MKIVPSNTRVPTDYVEFLLQSNVPIGIAVDAAQLIEWQATIEGQGALAAERALSRIHNQYIYRGPFPNTNATLGHAALMLRHEITPRTAEHTLALLNGLYTRVRLAMEDAAESKDVIIVAMARTLCLFDHGLAKDVSERIRSARANPTVFLLAVDLFATGSGRVSPGLALEIACRTVELNLVGSGVIDRVAADPDRAPSILDALTRNDVRSFESNKPMRARALRRVSARGNAPGGIERSRELVNLINARFTNDRSFICLNDPRAKGVVEAAETAPAPDPAPELPVAEEPAVQEVVAAPAPDPAPDRETAKATIVLGLPEDMPRYANAMIPLVVTDRGRSFPNLDALGPIPEDFAPRVGAAAPKTAPTRPVAVSATVVVPAPAAPESDERTPKTEPEPAVSTEQPTKEPMLPVGCHVSDALCDLIRESERDMPLARGVRDSVLEELARLIGIQQFLDAKDDDARIDVYLARTNRIRELLRELDERLRAEPVVVAVPAPEPPAVVVPEPVVPEPVAATTVPEPIRERNDDPFAALAERIALIGSRTIRRQLEGDLAELRRLAERNDAAASARRQQVESDLAEAEAPI